MSTVTPSAAEYSRITPELMQLTGLWAEHAHIDRELYQRYNVKRGLRDANGQPYPHFRGQGLHHR